VTRRADVVVCGAGIAGLSVAWRLATRHGLRRVLVVDERPPLTLTSDKSTECYRNWWPDRPMVELVNRSIELLDELAARPGNPIALNRNGYLYLTATAAGREALEIAARRSPGLGAGPIRLHRGVPGDPTYVEPDWDRPAPTADGADLFLDPALVRRRFPWAPADVTAALHARRCGWISAQQLGMLWLEELREAGGELVRGRVVGVDAPGGRVAGVRIDTGAGSETVATGRFVNAAGPFAPDVARLVGLELPLVHELHRKVFFDDHLGIVPRRAPLVIWNDPVTIGWSAEERSELAADPETRPLVGELPAGVHFRPEGGPESRSAILLWNYHADPVERRFPLPDDPLHLSVVVRGIARLLPAFAAYAEGGRRPYVDGGYYTKTPENRPLIGSCGPEGSYVLAGLSGFGIMAAPAAGELAARLVTGEPDSIVEPSLRSGRHDDPGFASGRRRIDAGQL